MHATIDADLRRFILVSVPSVPYLEALLLLREDPAHIWMPVDLARRLYLSEEVATKLLNELESTGIAIREESGGLTFRPISIDLKQMLDRLATAYTHNLIEVTHLIHSRLDKRAQQFADAFKWRRD